MGHGGMTVAGKGGGGNSSRKKRKHRGVSKAGIFTLSLAGKKRNTQKGVCVASFKGPSLIDPTPQKKKKKKKKKTSRAKNELGKKAAHQKRMAG